MTPAKRDRLSVILQEDDKTNLKNHMNKSFHDNDSNHAPI